MIDTVPEHVLAAAGRALKFRIIGEMNQALAASGLTIETVAARLGWSRRRVIALLKGRGDPGIRDIAEVCWAIDGSVPEFSMEPKATNG